ncbi:MAG TPA: ribonuclease III [Polyangiaceae bacterium]|nr:ribonuclease III [Polyangiaceae bacterium]
MGGVWCVDPLLSGVVREQVAQLFGLDVGAPHLDQALTHPSYANEQKGAADNQRLEFLGDSVLGFCTSELLYRRFGSADEGSLTRLRSQLVNADALAEFARAHGIGQALRLGRGATGGRLRDSTNVLADAVEALIAATYLDAGLESARRACEKIVSPRLATLDAGDERDPKSKLQELVQASGAEPPSYVVTETSGPAHQRWFTVEVSVLGRPVARGGGHSKRQAERAAAAAALEATDWREALVRATAATAPADPSVDSPGGEEPSRE